MAPSEWRLERLIQFQENRMAVVKKANGYWHDCSKVLRRHPTAEKLQGSDGFVISLQAGDLVTDPALRAFQRDMVLAEIQFRGHQKLTSVLAEKEQDIWGGRMLKDIFTAFYSDTANVGFGCNADTSWISEAKAIIDTGFPGWITCQATVIVKYPMPWSDT